LDNVIQICDMDRELSTKDADELVTLLKRITFKHKQIEDDLFQKQRWLMLNFVKEEKLKEYDNFVTQNRIRWGRKITRLGCKVFDGGFIGINSGFGYWSWHLGEDRIEYYHGYDEGPEKRRKLLRRDFAQIR